MQVRKEEIRLSLFSDVFGPRQISELRKIAGCKVNLQKNTCTSIY